MSKATNTRQPKGAQAQAARRPGVPPLLDHPEQASAILLQQAADAAAIIQAVEIDGAAHTAAEEADDGSPGAKAAERRAERRFLATLDKAGCVIGDLLDGDDTPHLRLCAYLRAAAILCTPARRWQAFTASQAVEKLSHPHLSEYLAEALAYAAEQATAQPAATACPVNALAPSLEAAIGDWLAAEKARDTEASEAASVRRNEIEDQAHGLQATSLTGAAMQVAFASGLLDMVRGADHQEDRDHFAEMADQCLKSVASVIGGGLGRNFRFFHFGDLPSVGAVQLAPTSAVLPALAQITEADFRAEAKAEMRKPGRTYAALGEAMGAHADDAREIVHGQARPRLHQATAAARHFAELPAAATVPASVGHTPSRWSVALARFEAAEAAHNAACEAVSFREVPQATLAAFLDARRELLAAPAPDHGW